MSESQTEMRVGDVIRARRWSHCTPTLEMSFSAGRTKAVALFLYLGSEPRDGSNPIDIVERMKALGWQPIPDKP